MIEYTRAMSSLVGTARDGVARRPTFVQAVVAIIVFIFVAVMQYWRLSAAQPTLLQDEYVYSTGSKYGGASEAARFGNFLYYELYQHTALCGADFYACARGFNAIWFVIFLVALFGFANRYFSPWAAIPIVAGIGLGPVAIFSSLYMPEMMYFALVSLGLVFFIGYVDRQDQSQKRYLLAAAFLFLALGSLVKPHAVFLAAGLWVYLVTTRLFRSGSSKPFSLRDLLLSVVVFLFAKLSIGWLLAGGAGLTIFGVSYTNALLDFFSDLANSDSDASTLVEEPFSEGISGAVDVILGHFLVTLVAVVILTGPLLASIVFSRNLFRTPAALVILSQLVFIGAIISVFAAHLSVNGDDHSDRLLFRYFEYLVPFVIIVGLHFAIKAELSGWRKTAALVVSLTPIIAMFTGLQSREWLIADSVYMFSIFTPADGVWVWSLVLVALSYLIFIPLKFRNFGLVVAVSLGTGALGQVGINQQLATNGFMISSDYAGLYVYENFPEVPGNQVLVIGSDRKLVEAAMFLIDKPNIDFMLFEAGTLLDATTVPDEVSLVVQTTGVFINDSAGEKYSGEGFAVTDLRR